MTDDATPAATSESAADDASFERPAGLAGSFAAHEPLPSAPPAELPAGAQETFGKPAGRDLAFDAPDVDRLPARHGLRPLAVPPVLQAAFAPSAAAENGFEPAPGTRLGATATPNSPWWKADAAVDPWRDARSAYFLGRPAEFVDNSPLAIEDGEPVGSDDAAEADVEKSAAPPAAATRFGRRMLLGLLGFGLLCTLVAGGIGGATGYLLTRFTDHTLHDPDIKLAQTGAPVSRAPGSVATVAKNVAPSVVQIIVRGTEEAGTGSGVVIDKGGYILTNNHVVSIAGTSGTIRVVFSDATIASARVVGRDPASDLAVIKVSHSPLTVIRLGDSSQLAVGDPVIAIGSPLGLQGTVTTGIVSALDRAVHVSGQGSDTDAVIDAIQTDAAINPGNSGGALVDSGGALIGIPSAGASLNTTAQGGSIGLGFAIPINSARNIAEQLIKTGRAVHASIGASTRSVTDGTRLGAYILQIDPGQAAANAGLKEGDVIKLVDKTLISDSDSLIVAINQHKPGDVVAVRYVRAGQEKTTSLTLGTAK